MPFLFNSIAEMIDRINEWCGRIVSWLVFLLVLIIVFDVAMRYLFQTGSVALQELEWHLFAILFLLGASYTLKHDGHVRVDVFYQCHWMNDRKRAWVDLLGSLFFLIPFSLLIIVYSWPFVTRAFLIAEGSPDPGGLPYRFLLKGVIPLAFILIILQGLAVIVRSIRTIRGVVVVEHNLADNRGRAFDSNKNKQ
ncbi:MAG: TRAP transporter small permease subunit [Gammaproteobacteria bacterium]|nr:TRAP transporter small permease subunit [Gammaproteobacteria bacterium]